MQKAMMAKRILLFVCVWVVIVSGCQAQTQKSTGWLLHASSQTAWQVPVEHSECPNMLDENQWYMSDDAVFNSSLHDPRLLLLSRAALHLFWADVLLSGLAALFTCVAGRIYYSSSCPTRALQRILAFILNADGQKDNISLMREGMSHESGLRRSVCRDKKTKKERLFYGCKNFSACNLFSDVLFYCH